MRTCDFCSKPVQDEALYCRHCHRDLPPSASLAGKMRCPYCAEWVPRGTLICPYCQKDLPRRVIPERAPEEAPPPDITRPWPPEEGLKRSPFIEDFTTEEEPATSPAFESTPEEAPPAGAPSSWEARHREPSPFLEEPGQEELTAASAQEQPVEESEPSAVSPAWDSPGSVWRSLPRDEGVVEPEPAAVLPREEEPEPPAPQIARPWDPRELLPSDEILEEPEETPGPGRRLLAWLANSLGLDRPLDEVLRERSASAAGILRKAGLGERRPPDQRRGKRASARPRAAEGPRVIVSEPLGARPEPESGQPLADEGLRAPAQRTMPSAPLPGERIPVEPLGEAPDMGEPAEQEWSGQFPEQEEDYGPLAANPPSASLWAPRPRPEPIATSTGQAPVRISNPVLGPPPPPPPSKPAIPRSESRSPVDYVIALVAVVVVVVVAILGLQSAGFNTPDWLAGFPRIGGNTPTRPPATPLPTLPPSPTIVHAAETGVTDTPTQAACLLWDQITLEDEGRTLCAYGEVKRWFVSGDLPFVALFTEEPGTLYIVDRLISYPEVSAGTCIMTTGVVEVMAGTRPFIDAAGELLTCP